MASFKQEKDHIIICGYGVVGQKIGEVLGEHMIDFIIVDNNDSLTGKLEEQGLKVVKGDATSSKTLKDAGIVGAKAIAVVMDNDAKNLFAVLTARDLNKKIFIVTRANDDFVREKLIEAGADYIVMPQKAASREIISELKKNDSG